MSAETCQICGNTKDVNVAGHCQGHASAAGAQGAGAANASVLTGASLKDQLDAIPTPSKLAAPDPGAAPAANLGMGIGTGAAPGQSASTTRAPKMSPSA